MPYVNSRALVLGTFGLSFGAAMGVAPALAQNLTITPTFDSSITSLSDASTVEASINTVIANFESDVTTVSPVSVSILFSNVNTGLGSSLTPTDDLSYSSYLSDLQANPSKSAIQTIAYATLPAGPNTGINNATQVLLTAANLAAIGETATAAGLVSGNGGYNSQISLNFGLLNDSRPDTNPSNYDLQSVATHEIDEVLGIGGNASTLYQPGSTPPTSLPSNVGPLDFFRYSAPGTRSFTYSSSAVAYFSITAGKTNLVYFNQQNGANGADFGDWGNPEGTQAGNSPPQVQDAFGTPGGEANLGANELTALNVEGYNLTAQGLALESPVPLPASAWLMLSGLLGLLGLRRRQAAI